MNLWNIASELDDVSAGLHQIDNLLHVYEEHIENEIEFLKEHDTTGTARYFVDRYDMLRSLMEVIQLHVYGAADLLQKQIDAIYAADKKMRKSPT